MQVYLKGFALSDPSAGNVRKIGKSENPNVGKSRI